MQDIMIIIHYEGLSKNTPTSECIMILVLQGLELNVGELQMYGSVNWLNALDELTKMKKGTELITLLFIFKSGVVLLAQERVRGKKGKPKVGALPHEY